MKQIARCLVVLLLWTAAADADVSVFELEYREPDGKTFGIDDQFILLVDNNIAHQKGLQARIFAGNRRELLTGAHRITSDGCKIYDSNTYPLYSIPGRINLGFILDERWLRYNDDGTLAAATYTLVIERTDNSRSMIKIPSGDGLETYLRNSFTFTVIPSMTARENRPLPVAKQPQLLASVANAATAREQRALVIKDMPEQQVEGDCIVFRVIPAAETKTPRAQLRRWRDALALIRIRSARSSSG